MPTSIPPVRPASPSLSTLSRLDASPTPQLSGSHAPQDELRPPRQGLSDAITSGARSVTSRIRATGAQLRSVAVAAREASYADVVRRPSASGRTAPPPERGHAKRARRREPSPPVLSPTSTLDAGPTPRQRFEEALEAARFGQPPAEVGRWQQALSDLCVTRGAGITAESLVILQQVLRMPASAQTKLAVHAQRLCDAGCQPRERRLVVGVLADLVAKGGVAQLDEVVAALGRLSHVARQRRVLMEVHEHVPSASRLHFLRMAEALLQAGHHNDVDAICEAAQLCGGAVRPRGGPMGARPASTHSPGDGAGSARAAPLFTAEDWAIINAAMDAQWDEVEVASDLHAEVALQAHRAAERASGEAGGGAVQADATDPGWEAGPSTARASAAEGPAVDALSADDRETLRQVQQGRRESVEEADSKRLLQQAWAYLGQRYRRELPEDALFVLVKGAYDAVTREARMGLGPFAADALPHLEKDWPNSGTEAAQRALLAKQKPLLKYQALSFVFEGRTLHADKMAAVLDDQEMSHQLNEKGVTTRSFVGILWSILHRRGDQAPHGTAGAARAARERDVLREGLWNAIADNVQVQVLRDGERRLVRLCRNGLAQRLVTTLEGYEPFVVTPMLPQHLLTQLTAEYAQRVEVDFAGGEPTLASVTAFVAQARTLARRTYGKARFEFFDGQLADYLHLTYEDMAAKALALG